MKHKFLNKTLSLRVMSAAVILLGAGLISYPGLKKAYYENESSRLIKIYKQELSNIEYGRGAVKNEKTADKSEYPETSLGDVIGILKIDQIALETPILEGTTKENLNLGITTIYGRSSIGGFGNLTLAGHNFRDYGRGFNRLDELEVDDIIEIEVKDNVYTYIVTDKQYINPEDTWILDSDTAKKEITLITCRYTDNKTLRLAVKGELEERDME